MKKLPIILTLLLLCMIANAAKGPEYKSLKVHGMGGAFVAVADNKNALYYNPAGLNLINRLGNFEKNPDMGYMRGEAWELNLVSTSTFLPSKNIDMVLETCGMKRVGTQLGRALSNLFTLNFGYFTDVDKWMCPVYKNIIPDNKNDLIDSLSAHPELNDDLNKLHRSPIEINEQVSVLEFAMHNFGLGVYMNTAGVSWIDNGIIVPYFGYEDVKLDAVIQTGAAFSPVDKWSVGVGFKMAKRVKRNSFVFGTNKIAEHELKKHIEEEKEKGESNPILDILENLLAERGGEDEKPLDSLKAEWRDIDEEFNCFECVFRNTAFGIDLGALYQIRRDVRLGASIRNIFFGELGDESIRPNLTIGAQASPMFLQSNSVWGRKINFAMDYADMLDGTVTDKFFAHLNFGAEIEQVAIPYVLTLVAGSGFEAGYWAWNAGINLLSVADIRIGSYAEERGTRTGQKEQRFYVMEASVGF